MAEVVIAVRGGRGAKTRCRALLTPAERAELIEAMLIDMLRAARAAPSVRRITVVTPTAALAPIARRWDADVLREPSPAGIGAALDRGRRCVAARSPDAVVALLPGDLPLLHPSELERAFALQGEDRIVIVPTERDGGTAAILFRASLNLPLAYGPNSFRRHIAATHAIGATPCVMIANGFGLDLDRPEDIPAVLAGSRDTCTAGVLTAMRRQEAAA